MEIIHLVVGNDTVEDIKEKFNEPVFVYIRKYIRTQDAKEFEIIEKFKNFIIENSKKYFENKLEKDSLIIEKEETKKDGKNIIPMKLSQGMNNTNLTFKKFYINSKGIHIFSSAIEPRYTTNLIQIKDEEYIEIEFELSGEVDIKEINHINDKEQIIFTIKGETKQSFDGEIDKKEFEFQPIINRFINETQVNDQTFFGRIFGKDENVKKKEYEIFVLKKSNIIKTDRSKFGIYTIQIPIKRNEQDNSFEENTE